jgi:hypothetical protein
MIVITNKGEIVDNPHHLLTNLNSLSPKICFCTARSAEEWGGGKEAPPTKAKGVLREGSNDGRLLFQIVQRRSPVRRAKVKVRE